MGIFEKALIEGEQIKNYIPQREPIIMIGGFHGFSSDKKMHTSLFLSDENIFCSNGYFCEAGIIEHIAQSCAFRNGYLAIGENKEVLLGYIGSVSALKIFSLPKTGSTLHTTIEVEQEFFGISLINAIVECEGVCIAQGKVKVALIQKEN